LHQLSKFAIRHLISRAPWCIVHTGQHRVILAQTSLRTRLLPNGWTIVFDNRCCRVPESPRSPRHTHLKPRTTSDLILPRRTRRAFNGGMLCDTLCHSSKIMLNIIYSPVYETFQHLVEALYFSNYFPVANLDQTLVRAIAELFTGKTCNTKRNILAKVTCRQIHLRVSLVLPRFTEL